MDEKEGGGDPINHVYRKTVQPLTKPGSKSSRLGQSAMPCNNFCGLVYRCNGSVGSYDLSGSHVILRNTAMLVLPGS